VSNKVLIACVGNIFLGDDAFGVEVAKRLAEEHLSEDVVVADFGIRSYDLAYALMDDWEFVILVDAMPRGSEPGTVYVMEPNLESDDESLASSDPHTMNPVSVLQMVRAMGGAVKRLLIVGCEPENIEPNGLGLSTTVRASLDEAIRVIQQLIADVRSEKKIA
jgi:hydrogenase maturation protease